MIYSCGRAPAIGLFDEQLVRGSHARHTRRVGCRGMELEEIFTPDDTETPREPVDDAVEL